MCQNIFKGLGIALITPFTASGIVDYAALEKLKQSTRRYAKRQLTWFGADKRIHWIEPDAQEEGETPLDRAMKLLEKEGTA